MSGDPRDHTSRGWSSSDAHPINRLGNTLVETNFIVKMDSLLVEKYFCFLSTERRNERIPKTNQDIKDSFWNSGKFQKKTSNHCKTSKINVIRNKENGKKLHS